MPTSGTIGDVDCTFSANGTFHFRVQFYLDAVFTTLAFEAKSEDNPQHFLVNGQPIPSGGLDGVIGQCYSVSYRPTKDFLSTSGLLDQLFYVKIEPILKNIIGIV